MSKAGDRWKGWAVWAALSISTVAGAASDRVAQLEQLLETVRAQPVSPARMGEEARLLHFLAEATGDSADRARYRKEGLSLAARALEENPEEPSALLWWTAHRGAQASALNPVQAVQIANEVERTLLKLRKVAPGFDASAADRVLGLVYQVAPPVVSIGSKAKAKKHLGAALKRHPDHPGNLLLSAKLLLDEGECETAKLFVAKVLASKESLEDPVEGGEWKAEAARLSARVSRECR